MLLAGDFADQPAAEEDSGTGKKPLDHVGAVKVLILFPQYGQLAVQQLVLLDQGFVFGGHVDHVFGVFLQLGIVCADALQLALGLLQAGLQIIDGGLFRIGFAQGSPDIVAVVGRACSAGR